MNEEIVILDPPQPLFIDLAKINIKKEIEINLYNKTNNNILYKSTTINPDIFVIKNPLSIIKPYSNINIQISFINKQNNLIDNNYSINFIFYKLNLYISNSLELNKIVKEKSGKENQKINVNIYFKNKSPNSKIINKEENNYIDKYIKLKNDLNEINNNIKISTGLNNNKSKIFNTNKIIAFMIIFLFVLISGIIFGVFLSNQYKKLFKKKINNNNKNNILEDDKDYIPINFMSVKDADDITEVTDENKIIFKEINKIDMLSEAKKIRQQELEDLKRFKNKSDKKDENKKNDSNLIRFKMLIFLLLIVLN